MLIVSMEMRTKVITHRDEQIEKVIANRDVPNLLRIFFDDSSGTRRVRDGVCHESELWDYKETLPDPSRSVDNDKSWADLAAVVLAFHNQHGGVVFFGVKNDFTIAGIRTRLDSKILNDKLRRHISDRIWIEFQRAFISFDQTCVAFILIPPRTETFERFMNAGSGFRYTFEPRGSAIREGDSTYILSEKEVALRTRQLALPTIDNPYEVDETFFRLLRREY